MQMIKCEITKVFSANDKGIGFAMKPDAITDEVKQLKTWNEKFKTLPFGVLQWISLKTAIVLLPQILALPPMVHIGMYLLKYVI